jgi:AmmeMemoRadiSam system protein B
MPAGEPRLILAPHIDFHRGAPVYADAYLPLWRSAATYDLVVVFGTDHHGHAEPFSLTRQSYATPLGTVLTDVGLVDDLTGELGEGHFVEELNHRREHSIEFQAVWLRHLFGEACPPLLPVLCGPFAQATRNGLPTLRPEVRRFLTALERRIAHRRVLVVAGADLAHVGPRFGDDAPFGPRERAEVEAADRVALRQAAAGDAEGFFAAIMGEGDRFRVCGTSPITAALALAGGRPRGLTMPTYTQCPADDDGASWVSVAALALW